MRTLRLTLADVAQRARLDAEGRLVLAPDNTPVSVFYFRAGVCVCVVGGGGEGGRSVPCAGGLLGTGVCAWCAYVWVEEGDA